MVSLYLYKFCDFLPLPIRRLTHISSVFKTHSHRSSKNILFFIAIIYYSHLQFEYKMLLLLPLLSVVCFSMFMMYIYVYTVFFLYFQNVCLKIGWQNKMYDIFLFYLLYQTYKLLLYIAELKETILCCVISNF